MFRSCRFPYIKLSSSCSSPLVKKNWKGLLLFKGNSAAAAHPSPLVVRRGLRYGTSHLREQTLRISRRPAGMMGGDRGPRGQTAAERRGGEPSGRGGSVVLRLGLCLILAAASAAQETSTRRDSNGVVLIFPSASHPYTSFVAPSGRHCGYLNVKEAASLPEKGRRIVLVDGLGLAYYFVLSSVSVRSTRPSQR